MSVQLTRKILPQVDHALVDVPPQSVFLLPEKVLQFGTGVLLRGLIDQCIHAANLIGDYAGRVVVIKSTDLPGADLFGQQDGLFTEYVRGIDKGIPCEKFVINAAISRVLNAAQDWPQILAIAADPALELVVSNTTEAGLVYDATDFYKDQQVPKTFPGKLLACLFHRWQTLGPSATGWVILPTELVVQNGDLLQELVMDLATAHDLPPAFMSWVSTENDFCNTLVDRIVPGKLPPAESLELAKTLGYHDGLLTVREPFGLWAIETDRAETRQKLGFARTVGNNVIVGSDISTFRELKLRLLNGAHSLSCALALQLGFSTVRQAMDNPGFFGFVQHLMQIEIAECLVANGIESDLVSTFAHDVLERFSNPYVEHQWASISLNYTEKMRTRILPLLLSTANRNGQVPAGMALGFGAFLCLYARAKMSTQGTMVSTLFGQDLELKDQYAQTLVQASNETIGQYLSRVLCNETLWQTNLLSVPAVVNALHNIMQQAETVGIRTVFEHTQVQQEQTHVLQKQTLLQTAPLSPKLQP